MKEYIKKFNTILDADFHIVDAPFIGSIMNTNMNISCNKDYKCLHVIDNNVNICGRLHGIGKFALGGPTYRMMYFYPLPNGVKYDPVYGTSAPPIEYDAINMYPQYFYEYSSGLSLLMSCHQYTHIINESGEERIEEKYLHQNDNIFVYNLENGEPFPSNQLIWMEVIFDDGFRMISDNKVSTNAT